MPTQTTLPVSWPAKTVTRTRRHGQHTLRRQLLEERARTSSLAKGRDHLIGGDHTTWRAAIRQRILPEFVEIAALLPARS
ncbi:hypothetical protein Adi01nite_59610 [Amorphoplanes digitatis]|nr:hypothetical protein Adi01nite_59610 [Actinoplanes digitatis]